MQKRLGGDAPYFWTRIGGTALNGRDLFLLLGQRLPLAVEQVDHRLQIAVLLLDLLDAGAVAEDLLAAEEEVVPLALALGRGDALLQRGDLLVDFLEALLALLLFGAVGLRRARL